MLRLLVSSYEILVEICLWILFLGMAVAGYNLGGPGGVAIALALTFVFGVLFIAPFSMLADIRKSTLRLEQIARESSTIRGAATAGGGTAMSPSVPKNELRMEPTVQAMSGTATGGKHIKVSKPDTEKLPADVYKITAEIMKTNKAIPTWAEEAFEFGENIIYRSRHKFWIAGSKTIYPILGEAVENCTNP